MRQAIYAEKALPDLYCTGSGKLPDNRSLQKMKHLRVRGSDVLRQRNAPFEQRIIQYGLVGLCLFEVANQFFVEEQLFDDRFHGFLFFLFV